MSAIEPAVGGSGHFRPITLEGLECCPTCEQAIPPERLGAVKGRLVARERELTTTIAAQFERARAQDQLKAQQHLHQVQRDAAAELENTKTHAEAAIAKAQAETQTAEARIRAEVEHIFQDRLATELITAQNAHAGQLQERDAQISQAQAAFQTQLADQVRIREESERELKAQIAQTELLQARQAQQALDLTAELERVKTEAQQSEVHIRAEMTKAFDEQLAASVGSIETTYKADLDRLRAQVIEANRTKEEALNAAQAEAERIKQDAIDATNAEAQQRELATQARLAEAESKLTGAETAKVEAEAELKAAQEAKDAEIAQVREVLERDKTTQIQLLQSKHFQDTQKLTGTVDTLKRQIEQRDAQELGDGAELELFEELKGRFEGDFIRRVKKGTPGADIIHEVRENGVVCGKIVYDSKNRQSWKTEYATKLRTDQLAEHADHAVLSSNRFREGIKQLDVVEHVIVACPARVLVIAEVLRQQIVQMHLLRASTQAKNEKTQELYAFMTSPRFGQHLETVNSHITTLETIDVTEAEAHQKIWTKRNRTIKALEKANGDLRFEVHRIIGADIAIESAPAAGEDLA